MAVALAGLAAVANGESPPAPRHRHTTHPRETFTFGQPLGLWVDGVEDGTVRSLSVAVNPDGAVIYV